MAAWFEQVEEEYCEWIELQSPDGIPYYYNNVTEETTWNKPEILMTEQERANQGDWVWLPHKELCFVPARVLGQQGQKLQLQTEDGEHHTALASKCDPLLFSSLARITHDLTLLDRMDPALILHNLKKRFEQDQIYTNIGTILVSINPYKRLPLYTEAVLRKHDHRAPKDVGPHVFAIANDAYNGLVQRGENQSCIISGESGAGKTECTKQVLQFLASVAGSTTGIEQKILLSNPILEAFGNAKTIRNDNSSRFGKYLEIFFNNDLVMVGGFTTNYLLEKVRVVQQGEGERNFHIFYQLTQGAGDTIKEKYSLGAPEYFHYLNQSGCTVIDGRSDEQEYKELMQAMQELNFSSDEQDHVFQTVACVLHLGNLEFTKSKDGCDIKDQDSVYYAANLLQVDPNVLYEVVTTRILKVRGQQATKVPMKPFEAANNRDAMSKFIYSRLFDWLVVKINSAMEIDQGKRRRCKSIGILDIFGFEIFKENSFEQLCINFTNEKLQQHFNANTFKLEEQLYKSEGIKFVHIEFIDNQPILDMIEKKPRGILRQLDEELIMPRGSDKGFQQKILQTHGKHPNFKRNMKVPSHFVLTHYAGPVDYNTEGFLEKNRDTLTEDGIALLTASSFTFLQNIFGGKKALQNISSRDRKKSLANQFQRQLSVLMTQLKQTEPHYIRCIKPNNDKASDYFVTRNAFEQLRYSGVFEAVRIRKQGFPFRYPHKQFIERYSVIMGSKSYSSTKQLLGDLVNECKLNQDDIRMGRSMVLYRAMIHKGLELKRYIVVEAVELTKKLEELCNVDISGMEDPTPYFEQLSRTIRRANEFNLQNEVAQYARNLLIEFIESRIDPQTKAELEEAIASVDEERLYYVLQTCDEYEYDTMLVRTGRHLYARVKRINEEAEKALITLDEPHLRCVVTAADEIKQSTDTLEYLREVAGYSKMKFIQAQMKAAIKLKDSARVIRLTIALKSIFFEKQGPMFAFKNFGKLKKPTDWAGEKLLTFSRDKFIVGMLKWQPKPIHASLTQVSKVFKKDSKRIFNDLLMYCGEKKTNQDTLEIGKRIIGKALTTPGLRDELYCQIIKQLTANTNQQSTKKAWDLMGLCILTFKPDQQFENYLEVFLRQNSKPMKHWVGCLHNTIYVGGATSIPNDSTFTNVAGELERNSSGFEEPLPDGRPSYHDLRTAYADLEPPEDVTGISLTKSKKRKVRIVDNTVDYQSRKIVKKSNNVAKYQQRNQKRNQVKQLAGKKEQQYLSAQKKREAEYKEDADNDDAYEQQSFQQAKPQQQTQQEERNQWGPWTMLYDESSGYNYYYNQETGASEWEIDKSKY